MLSNRRTPEISEKPPLLPIFSISIVSRAISLEKSFRNPSALMPDDGSL